MKEEEPKKGFYCKHFFNIVWKTGELVVPKKVEKKRTSEMHEVGRLLREFIKTTQKELHVRLPHQRSNSHHIDLNLESSLPNQATLFGLHTRGSNEQGG